MPFNESGIWLPPSLPGTWNPASIDGTMDPDVMGHALAVGAVKIRAKWSPTMARTDLGARA